MGGGEGNDSPPSRKSGAELPTRHSPSPFNQSAAEFTDRSESLGWSLPSTRVLGFSARF